MITNVVALQPRLYQVRKRDEIEVNIEVISNLIDEVMHSGGQLETRSKLITLPEQCLQGFAHSFGEMDPVEYAHTIAIDIPGPETDALGKKAKEYEVYIVGSATAVLDGFSPDLFFTVNFMIDPNGKVCHAMPKTICGVIEPITTPFDVWDQWVEKYGDGLDSFFPVADTPFGKIGTIICKERCFPETARGLAMNGAEIITMPTFPAPLIDRKWFDIQVQARALDNTVYAIAGCSGPYYSSVDAKVPWSYTAGGSMIVNYKGEILCKVPHMSEGFAAATINIEELREYRRTCALGGGIPYVMSEMFRKIYDIPIYPKNLCANGPKPRWKKDRVAMLKGIMDECVKKGIYS